MGKLVWAKAAGLCAFPECRATLVSEGANGAALLGEIAHIVAHSGAGPRADHRPPGGAVDGEPNLVLLCPTHHTEVDRQLATWTVEKLIGVKETHERWVRDHLSIEQSDSDPGSTVEETVHSTLLRVASIPRYVYLAPCALDERDVKSRITVPAGSDLALPYIVRKQQLLTFNDLTDDTTPFRGAFTGAAERHDATKWWDDPDLSAWYVTLLNRSLNKVTGRRGLHLDKNHSRYFFAPDLDEAGAPKERSVAYQPLNQAKSTKSVVWRPIRKKTGEKKRVWTHLAVGLAFTGLPRRSGWSQCDRSDVLRSTV